LSAVRSSWASDLKPLVHKDAKLGGCHPGDHERYMPRVDQKRSQSPNMLHRTDSERIAPIFQPNRARAKP
jgi:hypothetical protein